MIRHRPHRGASLECTNSMGGNPETTGTPWCLAKKKKGIVRIPSKLLAEMRTWEQDGPNVILYEGRPVANIKTAFNQAVLRAGLEDVTPHTLKHTAVTWAFIEGMSLEMATDYLATSRETLEDVYRSYSPDAQKDAAAIMGRTL